MDDLDKTERYVRLRDVMGCLYDTLESYYIKRNIMNLPTYDVKSVVRGKWGTDRFKMERMICSECGVVLEWSKINNFCPNCGADMREG